LPEAAIGPPLQFDLTRGKLHLQFQPKPDRIRVGLFSCETFRFRVERKGEAGHAFAFFSLGVKRRGADPCSDGMMP